MTAWDGSSAHAEGSVGGHGAVSTDYVFRGVSQTRGAPAVQADLHYDGTNGVFFGAWASTVDLNPGPGATREFNLYAGRGWLLQSDWTARVAAVAYIYPDDDPTLDYDYVELIASIGWLDRVVASVAWSPNTSRYSFAYGGAAHHQPALTYEIVGSWPLVSGLSATGSAGYYDLSDLFGTGYSYGSAGLSYAIESLQFDLAWYASQDQARELFGREVAGPRWALTAVWRFRCGRNSAN